MGALPLPKSDYYTYADYGAWDLKEGERYELIDGVPYMMAAPTTRHQLIVGEIYGQLREFLKGKPCTPFVSPVDVCLFGKGDEDDTVVQPDILVVCDKSKIDEKRCNGAPDFIVEVLSPSVTAQRRDRWLKYQKYEFAGVLEYWLVDPEALTAETCVLENGKYKITQFSWGGTIPVTVLDGCKIIIKEI